MKNALKSQTLVYQVRSTKEDAVFVGTRHWMLRVQYVADALRKSLANVGLFNEGAISLVGKSASEVTAPNIENIFPAHMDGYQELTRTPFTVDIDDKTKARVFMLPDGTNICANETYIADIEAAFQTAKHKHQFTWHAKGPNEPLIYGNRLALVLPYRMGDKSEAVKYKVNKI